MVSCIESIRAAAEAAEARLRISLSVPHIQILDCYKSNGRMRNDSDRSSGNARAAGVAVRAGDHRSDNNSCRNGIIDSDNGVNCSKNNLCNM